MKNKVLQLSIFLAIIGICFAYLNRYSFAYIDAPGFGKNVPFLLYALFGSIVGYGVIVFAVPNKLVTQIALVSVILCVVADLSALVILVRQLTSSNMTATFIIIFHSLFCLFVLGATFWLMLSALEELEGGEEIGDFTVTCKCGRKVSFDFDQAGTKVKCSCGRMIKIPAPSSGN